MEFRRADRIPRQVGPYLIKGILGSGAHATVFRAIHANGGDELAIKVLDLSQASQESIQKFKREIALAPRVVHKNVPAITDIVQDDANLALVMQLAPGGDMLDYLNEHGCLDEGAAAFVFSQVYSALEAAHKLGIAHRDVKLENILIGRDAILLGDWGYATECKPTELLQTFCGTRGYCAPEVGAGQPYYGSKADVFSLGAALYAMVTGRTPYEDKDTLVLPDNLSADLRALLSAMLEPSPATRVSFAQIRQLRWWRKHCKPGSMIGARFKSVLRLMADLPRRLSSSPRRG